MQQGGGAMDRLQPVPPHVSQRAFVCSSEIAAPGGHWQARTVAGFVAAAAVFSKVGDADAFRAGSVDIAFIKTHLSLGFRWNSCRRPVHVGAGSGGGRSSAISRGISANSLLVTADFGIGCGGLGAR